jgi:hypothetical protein
MFLGLRQRFEEQMLHLPEGIYAQRMSLPATFRPCNHATAIIFSAVTMGVARAQAYCDNPGPAVAHCALFDSDSFDILVNGGASTRCSIGCTVRPCLPC